MQTIRYLTLWPTATCRLTCRYCYRQERSSGDMPLETAFTAVELAARSNTPFHLQFAGGEPTLALSVVRAVVERVRKKNLPATLAIQTNGTHIDEAFARFCRQHDVEVGLSLDGPRVVHDELRGRFVDTIRGLELLNRQQVPVQITAVLTATSARHLSELALLLSGFSSVRGLAIDPLVSLGSARSRADLEASAEDIDFGLRALHQTLVQLNRLRKAPLRFRELELVKAALDGRVRPAYCHACRGESVAVAPDGAVYPCSQVLGDASLRAGTIWNVDWQALMRAFPPRRLEGPCCNCQLQGRCPSDCPSRLRVTPPATTPSACLIYRTLADLETA